MPSSLVLIGFGQRGSPAKPVPDHIPIPNERQLRILHVVDAAGTNDDLQQQLFMPLLTRMPQNRISTQIASLSPDAVPAAVLRQCRIPVHDVSFSRRRFSWRAVHDLLRITRLFRPDLIQAWGHTAQLLSILIGKRCGWRPPIIWSVAASAPLAHEANMLDRWKSKWVARCSRGIDRIVYASESAAARHRRAGFAGEGYLMVPPGVDGARFKPDLTARSRLREQLQIDPETVVIGMSAPFRPQSDHATALKAIAELIKSHPRTTVLLAGHGVQKGNAALMALLGSGSLAACTHLLGEWSDLAALYNACDVVCSSALHDNSRMQLVMAMLCGVPCIATGVGAQGEVLGRFGIAVEPGSSAGFLKGLGRLLQLTPQKRLHLMRGARNHALRNYINVHMLQGYLQLYYELTGCDARASEDIPAGRIDVDLPLELPDRTRRQPGQSDAGTTPKPAPSPFEMKRRERPLPKRQPAKAAQGKHEPGLMRRPGMQEDTDDVLMMFDTALASESGMAESAGSARHERARGVAEECEDLLAPEALRLS